MHRSAHAAAAFIAAVTLSACGGPATYEGNPAVAVKDAAAATADVLEQPHAIDVTFIVDEQRLSELTESPVADGADALFGEDLTVRTTVDPGVGVALALARAEVGIIELRHFIDSPTALYVRASGTDLETFITDLGAGDDRAVPAITNLLTVFSDLFSGDWVTVTDVPPGTVDITSASVLLSGTSDAIIAALEMSGSQPQFVDRTGRGDQFLVDLPAEAFPPGIVADGQTVPVQVWVDRGRIAALGVDVAGFLPDGDGKDGIVQVVTFIAAAPALDLPDSTAQISGRDIVARLFGAPGAST